VAVLLSERRTAMQKQITSGLRILFVVHGVVGLVFGLAQLLAAEAYANLVGLPLPDPFLLRLVGAAILGFTASSWLALLATTWNEIRIIVAAEVVWATLGALVMLWAVLAGVWPALAWVNIIILAAFAVAFAYYYFYEASVVMPRLGMSPRS
jgi:hypothetical protein